MESRLERALRVDAWNAGVDALVFPEVLPGLVGRYAEWVMNCSRLPNWNLAKTVGMTAVGAAMASHVVGPTESSTVLFHLVFGRTGIGKQQPRECLQMICREIGLQYVIARYGSSRGLEDDIIKLTHWIAIYDEYADWLERLTHGRNLDGPMADILPLEKDLWSLSGPAAMWQNTRTQLQKGEQVSRPCYTKFAISVEESLFRAFKRRQMINGWLNRHLLTRASDSGDEREPEWSLADGMPQDLLEETREFMRWMLAQPHIGRTNLWRMGFKGDGAEDCYRDLVKEMRRAPTDFEKGTQSRIAEQALRMSQIVAGGQMHNTVSLEDFEWAKEWSCNSLVVLRGGVDQFSQEEMSDSELADAIWEWVYSRPGHMAKRHEISHRWARNAKGRHNFSGAMGTLLGDQGRLVVVKPEGREQGGGTPQIVYRAVVVQ